MSRSGKCCVQAILWLFTLGFARCATAAEPATDFSANEQLTALLARADGQYSTALRNYYLDRSEQLLRSTAKVNPEIWTWLATHPEIRAGLFSASYPVPARYLENLAALRGALGPAVADKYPQLILAMSLRTQPITDPNASELSTRSDADDVDDDADEEDAVMPLDAPNSRETDPRIAKVATYIKDQKVPLADIIRNPEPVFSQLGLSLPKPGARKPLWDAIALASATYPPREQMALLDYLKLIISRYESRPPDFKTGPRWPLFPLDRAPWPLLLPLRPVPRNEADWAWDLFTGRIQLRNGKRIMTYGTYTWSYLKPEVRYRPSPWHPDSIQRIVEDGGVCTRMSSLAQITYLSLAQPATGVGQPGHATLLFYGYDEASDRYVTRVPISLHGPFHTHARWYIPGVEGYRANPKNNIVGIEYHDGLALAMNVGLDRYVDTRIACHLAAMLPDSAREQKIRLLESAVKLNPYNVELWYAMADLCDNDPQRVNALVEHIEQALPQHVTNKGKNKKNPESKLTQELTTSANATAQVICSEIVRNTYEHLLSDTSHLQRDYKLLQDEVARREHTGLQYDPSVLNLLLRYQLALNGITPVKSRLTAELCAMIQDDKQRKNTTGIIQSVNAALPYLGVEEKLSWLQQLRNAFPSGTAFIQKRNGETVPNKLYDALYEEQLKVLRKLGKPGADRLHKLQQDFNLEQSVFR